MRNQVRFVTPEDFETIIGIVEKGDHSPWLAPVLRTLFATGCRPAELVGTRFKPGREPEEGGTRISRRKAHHGLRARDVQPNHRLFVEGKHTTPTGRTLALKPRVVLCADPNVWEALRRRADAAPDPAANLFLPRSRSRTPRTATVRQATNRENPVSNIGARQAHRAPPAATGVRVSRESSGQSFVLEALRCDDCGEVREIESPYRTGDVVKRKWALLADEHGDLVCHGCGLVLVSGVGRSGNPRGEAVVDPSLPPGGAEAIARHGFIPNDERDANGSRIPIATRERLTKKNVHWSERSYRDDMARRRTLATFARKGASTALRHFADTGKPGVVGYNQRIARIRDTVERLAEAAPLHVRLGIDALPQVDESFYRVLSPRHHRPRQGMRESDEHFEARLSAWQAKKNAWYAEQKRAKRSATRNRAALKSVNIAVGAILATALVAHAGVVVESHDHDSLSALVGIDTHEWNAYFERAIPEAALIRPRRHHKGRKRPRLGVRKRERAAPPPEGVPVGRSGRFVRDAEGIVHDLRPARRSKRNGAMEGDA